MTGLNESICQRSLIFFIILLHGDEVLKVEYHQINQIKKHNAYEI